MTEKYDGSREDDASPAPPAHAYAAFIDLIRGKETDQMKWAAAYAACRVCAVAQTRRRWPGLGDGAEGVFSCVCQSACRAIYNGSVIPDPAAWFFAALDNAAGNEAKKLAKMRQRFVLHTDMSPVVGEAFDPEAHAETHMYDDEKRNLRDAIAELPDRQRDAIEGKYLKSHTHAEIAETLHCSVGAVRILVHRGLKALREMMKGDDND